MNIIKKLILSGLLFSFSLLALHDYIVEYLDSNTQANIFKYKFCNSLDELDELDELNELVLHVHDNIHTLLSVPISETVNIFFISAYLKTQDPLINFTSQVNKVPQRPPLS